MSFIQSQFIDAFKILQVAMSATFELQDELEALQDLSSYEIPNEHDLHNTEAGPLLQRAYPLKADDDR